LKYIVCKAFIDLDGATKNIGDFIELNNDRAAKLRRYGLIGTCPIQKVEQIETASVEVEEVETASVSKVEMVEKKEVVNAAKSKSKKAVK
jgi:phage protein D